MNLSTESVWALDTTARPARPLESDTACDICVVGAGIAGLTVAYQLAREGRSVVVLESRERPATGESFSTTAHLSSVIDDRFARLKSIRGERAVFLAHQSHAAAIKKIETIVDEEHIDCDFGWLDGYLFHGENDDGRTILQEEKVCREAGIDVHLMERPTYSLFRTGPALRFPNQAKFHPLKYLEGLARAALRRGVRFYFESPVQSIIGGKPAGAVSRGGPTVHANAVILATNAPIQGGLQVNLRIASYTSYAIAAPIPNMAIWPALFWDTDNPYHYIRTQTTESGECRLIVGGEDHKTGQEPDPSKRWDRLESWMRDRFPDSGPTQYRWDGQVFETPDGLALIGPDPGGAENVYIVTGDSGMGLTHGTIAGLLLPDLIAGRANFWTELYSPSRLPALGVGTVLREGINTATQMVDWVTGGDVSSPDRIEPGQGATIRKGLIKQATHRKVDGTICRMSAICPHMGGVVRWNPADQTWDCPMHGSRFSANGEVLHGPATEDLTKIIEPVDGPFTTNS